jgi:hypothetical protein
MQTKTWTTTIEDAGDGSGDVILTFPDELIAEKGWKEGTEVILQVIDNGTSKSLIIIENKNDENKSN